MNNKVDLEIRLHFTEWLKGELRTLDFYQRRGDHYLIREFSKYCKERGKALSEELTERAGHPVVVSLDIDEASLGRYLRFYDPAAGKSNVYEPPVLPTPARCRTLAKVLGYAPAQVLAEAGYIRGDDFYDGTETEDDGHLPLPVLMQQQIDDYFQQQQHPSKKQQEHKSRKKGLAGVGAS